MEPDKSTTTDNELMTYVAAAQYLHIASRTLAKMKIPCTKLGRVIYYRKYDLDNLENYLTFKPLAEWREEDA